MKKRVEAAAFNRIPKWFFNVSGPLLERKIRFSLDGREWVSNGHVAIMATGPDTFRTVGPETIGTIVRDSRRGPVCSPGVPFIDSELNGRRASHYLVPLGSCAVLMPYIAAVGTLYPGAVWREVKAGKFFCARIGSTPVACIAGNLEAVPVPS